MLGFGGFCGARRVTSPGSQGPLNGGVSNGGVSRSGFVLPFLSFFVLFCPFLSFLDFPGDFPDLRGDGPGTFLICPFPLSQPIKSTYEEQSRKGPRHNLDLSRKKWETPGLETPRFSFSQGSRTSGTPSKPWNKQAFGCGRP